ncbi:hypothetical protein MMC22_005214 [Lobaria immixta]|nr:hypothetical protein [Lobaria immixta]
MRGSAPRLGVGDAFVKDGIGMTTKLTNFVGGKAIAVRPRCQMGHSHILCGAMPQGIRLFEVDSSGAMISRKKRRHPTGWKEPYDFATGSVGGVLQDLFQARAADQLRRSAWTNSRTKGHMWRWLTRRSDSKKWLGLGLGRLYIPFENST